MKARPARPTRLGPKRLSRNAEGNAVIMPATAMTDMSQPVVPGSVPKSCIRAPMNVGTLNWFMMTMMPQNSMAKSTIQPLRWRLRAASAPGDGSAEGAGADRSKEVRENVAALPAASRVCLMVSLMGRSLLPAGRGYRL